MLPSRDTFPVTELHLAFSCSSSSIACITPTSSHALVTTVVKTQHLVLSSNDLQLTGPRPQGFRVPPSQVPTGPVTCSSPPSETGACQWKERIVHVQAPSGRYYQLLRAVSVDTPAIPPHHLPNKDGPGRPGKAITLQDLFNFYGMPQAQHAGFRKCLPAWTWTKLAEWLLSCTRIDCLYDLAPMAISDKNMNASNCTAGRAFVRLAVKPEYRDRKPHDLALQCLSKRHQRRFAGEYAEPGIQMEYTEVSAAPPAASHLNSKVHEQENDHS